VKGKTLGAAIKLIIFAVITTLAAGLLGVVISNRTFGATRTYHAVFSDVTALLSGNDVRMAGVRVGTVKSIDVVPVRQADGTTKAEAEVAFSVDKDVPVTTTTHVEIHYLNLVGQRYLALVETPGRGAPQDPKTIIGCQVSTGNGSRQIAKQGSVCVAGADRTAPAVDLTALFNGFKPLFQALTPSDVNSFALEIIKTLQGEGGTVQSLLAQTASLTNTVANRDAVIGQVVDNLDTVLGTVEQRNAGLNETIVQLQRLVTGLAGDRGTIAASLSHIDTLASSSSQLIAGIRPYLPSDLRSLAKLAHNLNTTKDADGQNTLTGILKREPAKLNRIIRTASYGGYFNFWLCQLDVSGVPTFLAPIPGSAPSCPAAS
jgi:phospholipid/cholesterol/gamma-HCH transport system substrate-binding protein